ncbi:hypothetical protein N7467_002771 [Penicillium canescens]|nr:hypothetical protein N7467_002771 [Penicillium canescens]
MESPPFISIDGVRDDSKLQDDVMRYNQLLSPKQPRCWMKQGVSAPGRVKVSWVPNAEMPADGFTKAQNLGDIKKRGLNVCTVLYVLNMG